MECREITLNRITLAQLLALSAEWEEELICYGYRRNGPEDYENKRIFVAEEDGNIIAYLMGYLKEVDWDAVNPAMRRGATRFIVDEFYVNSAFRSRGVGSQLFRYVEETVREYADYIDLGTATKDYQAILHFYIEQMGMEFWSARLFKELR